jgi:uncharacterized phage-like protein YoqJ
MIVAVTGHRPDKLGTKCFSGYAPENPLRAWVKTRLREQLLQRRPFRPLYGITGMALGVDQDFAEVCIELDIPFIAAVPFIGQERQWPTQSRERYRELLAQACDVVIVCTGGYERWKMLARNQWMVDHCNTLFAVFDGTPGGTASTVLYADSIQREVLRIDPNEFRGALAAGAAS